MAIIEIASLSGTVWGLLHRALVGGDARGLFHASTKRREVVCLLKRSHSSGAAVLRALLSRRLLVTSRHVILKLGPCVGGHVSLQSVLSGGNLSGQPVSHAPQSPQLIDLAFQFVRAHCVYLHWFCSAVSPCCRRSFVFIVGLTTGGVEIGLPCSSCL